MPIVANRFFHDPAIGQGFANIAAMFAPPSAQDTAAYARAAAERAEAEREAEAWERMTAEGVTPEMVDRYGIAIGRFNPTQSNRALDLNVTTARRGQDMDSADRRYGIDTQATTARRGQDLDAETMRANNAADNARALGTARLGGLADFFGPLAEGAVRPAVPADIASQFGAPGALPEAHGRAAPLSSDETIAVVMGGMPLDDQRQFVRDKFAPSETQVQGEERRRLAEGGLLSDQALLDAITGAETPVEAIGTDGRPTFMTPGAAARTGAQPAPRSPMVSVNTGAVGDGKLREKLDENEGKRWSDLQGAAATASGLQGDLEILSELIDQAPQGPVIGRFNELFPEATTAGAAFQSIIARAAPGLRVEGSGATSDIEYEGMVRSLPRLRNDPEANRLIIEAMRAKAAINMRRGEIITAYQNNEIDAVAARRQLSDLNRQSVLSPGLRSMVDAAGGAAAPAAAGAAAPVRVTTPEEARQLPSGTAIILPDGTEGRVP